MKQILFIISVLALFFLSSCKQDVIPATHQRYDPVTAESVDAMQHIYHNNETFTGILDQSSVDLDGTIVYADPSNTISYEVDGADGTRPRNVEAIRHTGYTCFTEASWIIIKYDGSLVALPCLLTNNTSENEAFKIITIYSTANQAVGNYVAVPASFNQKSNTGGRLAP